MVLQNRVNLHTTRMIPQSETGDWDDRVLDLILLMLKTFVPIVFALRLFEPIIMGRHAIES